MFSGKLYCCFCFNLLSLRISERRLKGESGSRAMYQYSMWSVMMGNSLVSISNSLLVNVSVARLERLRI